MALYNGRIANLSEPMVQAVLNSRVWPQGTTAQSCTIYADMMQLSCDPADDGKTGLTYHPKMGVNFTSKGDRDAVKYNFFKMTMTKDGLGF